ncbi:gamma-glutamylcyclotransferase family protein [Paenibacillus xylaniclasticus]|uniref:gamma-glutamylcyclotransferase family protein n=1 Tax=Paenibacillus xylaniclasticus TaxID=588083 RepID=UPI00157FB140|nr:MULTISPECIES: gamma-glutamylcyclotransferase family protein [Paenibacillus]GFN31118.1 hypothetical protein PCURB6_13780 [Paenibacillus curdlanolyticus]
MSRIFRVFVYGSLLPNQHNHYIVKQHIIRSESGKVAGRLVDCGSYPALVRDQIAVEQASLVKGQWITVDEAGLAAMDELEEFYGYEESNDYDRVWVKDVEQRQLEGWVYVWETDRGCPAIHESYWPDYYANQRNR